MIITSEIAETANDTAKQNGSSLDWFKLAAALLVVAIHTSPLLSFNEEADFFLTRVLARLAVPFFLTVTGHFVLTDYIRGNSSQFTPIKKYIKKILLLYGAAIVLYLPIGIYAGHYQNLSPLELLRMLLFDGTFYHLWYFPALIVGILLLCLLKRFLTGKIVFIIVIILYLIGLLGDSYWGLISESPKIAYIYQRGFQFFTYTRNGIFMAPLFLFMGTELQQKPLQNKKYSMLRGIWFMLAFSLMTVEAFLLRFFKVQRHDSMYLSLPFCIFFLCQLLLSCQCKPSKKIRKISSCIYLLHPAMIVVVRGAAKLLHAENILIKNSIGRYTAVCLLSVCAALLLVKGSAYFNTKPYKVDRAWIELDRKALRHNAAVLQSLLPKGCCLMPVIKSNAYGHGAVLIAKELNAIGIRQFCVACISEGIQLRKKGVKGKILILGYTHPNQFFLLRRYRLTQTVVDYSYAKQLNAWGKKLSVHIAVDTGMHRLGERSDHITQFDTMFQMKKLHIEGIFTHLCAADTDTRESREFTEMQLQKFFQLLSELQARGHLCPPVHLQSSYGVLNYAELPGNYARVGIALYGVRSAKSDYDKSAAPLQPVLSLKARIATVKELYPGESAGYGLAFTANRFMKIAVLTIGYGDGVPRTLSCGKGTVLIRGQRAPVIGQICMDQTTVDVTDISNVLPGDAAVLIGPSGSDCLTAYDMAEAANTITNEIFSQLGSRLNRIVI